MKPQLLFWLSVVALGVLVLSIVIPAIPVLGCLAGTDAAPTACMSTITVAVFIMTSLIMVGGILATAAWIIGLVLAGQREEWGWFVAIIFLTPVATILYARLLASRIEPSRRG